MILLPSINIRKMLLLFFEMLRSDSRKDILELCNIYLLVELVQALLQKCMIINQTRTGSERLWRWVIMIQDRYIFAWWRGDLHTSCITFTTENFDSNISESASFFCNYLLSAFFSPKLVLFTHQRIQSMFQLFVHLILLLYSNHARLNQFLSL